MPLPRWTRANPGKGRHGVPDKGADKVGKEFEKQNEKDQRREEKK